MLEAAVTSFLFSGVVYVVTAIICMVTLGKKPVVFNILPSGIVGACLFVEPWYIALIFGLIGHIVAVVALRKL